MGWSRTLKYCPTWTSAQVLFERSEDVSVAAAPSTRRYVKGGFLFHLENRKYVQPTSTLTMRSSQCTTSEASEVE